MIMAHGEMNIKKNLVLVDLLVTSMYFVFCMLILSPITPAAFISFCIVAY